MRWSAWRAVFQAGAQQHQLVVQPGNEVAHRARVFLGVDAIGDQRNGGKVARVHLHHFQPQVLGAAVYDHRLVADLLPHFLVGGDGAGVQPDFPRREIHTPFQQCVSQVHVAHFDRCREDEEEDREVDREFDRARPFFVAAEPLEHFNQTVGHWISLRLLIWRAIVSKVS